MGKMMNYIEDKVEEFRISGKKPHYLGLSKEVLDQFEEECTQLRGFKVDGILTEFLGLPVICMGGSIMPEDGVYIHDANSPRESHPFDGREDW